MASTTTIEAGSSEPPTTTTTTRATAIAAMPAANRPPLIRSTRSTHEPIFNGDQPVSIAHKRDSAAILLDSGYDVPRRAIVPPTLATTALQPQRLPRTITPPQPPALPPKPAIARIKPQRSVNFSSSSPPNEPSKMLAHRTTSLPKPSSVQSARFGDAATVAFSATSLNKPHAAVSPPPQPPPPAMSLADSTHLLDEVSDAHKGSSRGVSGRSATDTARTSLVSKTV